MENDIQIFNDSVKRTNDNEVFVKPLCDFFGINYKHQSERIKRDEICQSQVGKNRLESYFHDTRDHLTLSRKGFLRWIQLLNAEIVRPELRSKFIEFQANVFDFLYQGNVIKDLQLQDILQFNKEASRLKSLYGRVGNAIQRRNFGLRVCVQSTPEEWADKREKYFPEQKAIN